ncbi:Uncharacterized protein SCF082_LOCUS17912, partial [Durusdinium trenchii]
DLSTVLARAGWGFAKRHYGLTSLWIVGLLLLTFATGFAVTEEQERAFSEIIQQIDYARLSEAERQVYFWDNEYYNSKGFFSCDDLCNANYAKLVEAQARLADVEREFAAIKSQAKQQ